MKSGIRRILKGTFFALLACALPTLQGQAQSPIDNLTFLTEDYPPFNFEQDGRLSGISTEIVAEMLTRSGSALTTKDVKLLPWVRGYHLTLAEPNHALFSTTRTPSREERFKWVGPFVPTVIGVIAKKEKGLKIETLDDLSALRIGVVKDDIGQLLLEETGFPRKRMEPVLMNDQNYKKLFADRIDAIAYETKVAAWQIAASGQDQNEFEVIHELKRSELYLALNLETPDAVVEMLQTALEAMKEDGTHAAILEKYLNK